MNDHLNLLSEFRSADPETPAPSRTRLTRHLKRRVTAVGDPAFAEFAYLHKRAAEIWGAEGTAHFAGVLRQTRVTAKIPRLSTWTKAEALVERLPGAWRIAILDRIEASRPGRRAKGRPLLWSADHTRNVIWALIRWSEHCRPLGLDLLPIGAALDAYAQDVAHRATDRTAADYIARVLSGLSVVAPEFDSVACAFVVSDWEERAAVQGARSKTGAQLVGASRIYDLGFAIMAEARARELRGVRAAKEFRNGVLLAMAAALPQRARALSSLEFGRTLELTSGPEIHVRIPAHMLKLPEARKSGEPFDRTLSSEKLATALREYRMAYRPLFDDGAYLFPSMLARNAAISERQIGRLVGDLTEKAFGVRVSIHRVRDNVATEASERLLGGAHASSVLLSHRDLGTTQRYYDHSTGLSAAQEFLQLVDRQRRASTALVL